MKEASNPNQTSVEKNKEQMLSPQSNSRYDYHVTNNEQRYNLIQQVLSKKYTVKEV